MDTIVSKQTAISKQKTKNIKIKYLCFLIVYFSLSLSISYITVYLPIFLLGIINVNRNALALIQILTYSFLFLAPLFALVFDKFLSHKKKILSILIIIFILSFFGLFSFFSILSLFGILLGINLFSHEAIKVGMGQMIVEASISEKTKDTILIIINISSNLGGYIPSLLYLFIVSNIFNLNLWSNFFLIGGISLIPLIFSLFLQNEKLNISNDKDKKKKHNMNSDKYYYYQIFLLCVSFIMIWSDKLYSYPFGSWLLDKFGEEGIKIFSICYIIFLILNSFGHILGKYIAKKIKRKNIILTTNSIFIGLTFLMMFSTNIAFLIVVYSLNWFISGIMMLNYISLNIDFCKNVKLKAVSYQILRVAVAIASVIFIPLGTYISSFISTEHIFLIAGIIALFSLIPLFFINIRKKVNP